MDIRIIEAVLHEQKEEFLSRLQVEYCPRREESLVDLDSNLAQVIVGVRRSGKSTLCINVIKKSGIPFAYVNFDDERFASLESEDLNRILECLYKLYGDFNHLFIDEIQNINGWYLFVNRLLRTNMRILITGSNAKLLSGELATHLTGRYMKTELFPFSFRDYCTFFKSGTSYQTTKDKGLLRAVFDNYLNDGGFPELLTISRKRAYVSSLVDNIIRNDIEKRYKIRYKAAFEQMMQHLLNTVPATVNFSDLQKQFAFRSYHTAENYYSYAKNAYLICGLPKYSTKSKLRIRDEKAYAVDVALMNNRENSFSGANLGWRLETIVYLELLRRNRQIGNDVYYYSETNGEADFIVCEGNKVKQVFQVCYDISNSKTLEREIRGLALASVKTGCDDLVLITDHEQMDLSSKGRKIKVVPAYAWLLQP